MEQTRPGIASASASERVIAEQGAAAWTNAPSLLAHAAGTICSGFCWTRQCSQAVDAGGSAICSEGAAGSGTAGRSVVLDGRLSRIYLTRSKRGHTDCGEKMTSGRPLRVLWGAGGVVASRPSVGGNFSGGMVTLLVLETAPSPTSRRRTRCKAAWRLGAVGNWCT